MRRITKGRTTEIVLGTGLVLLFFEGFRQLHILRGTLKWDPDEFQHAHIAWQTFRGKLIYRDFFEHHGPLFAFWNALILKVSGGEPSFRFFEVLRGWNEAYLVATAAVVFTSSRRLSGSAIAGLGSAALFMSVDLVARIGVPVRPDALGGLLVAGMLAALLFGRPFTAGILAGAALGVHPKLIGVTGCVLLGATAAAALRREPMLRRAVRLASGIALVWIALAGFFLTQGGFGAFIENAWWVNFEMIRTPRLPGVVLPQDLRTRLLIDLPFWGVLLASMLFALTSIFGAGHWKNGRSSRLFIAFSLVAMLPLLPVRLWPQYLLAFIPMFCLAPALISRRYRRVTALVLLAVIATQLHRSARQGLGAVGAHALEQVRQSNRVLSESVVGEQAIYLWPSTCAAYVFLDDPAWMWMLSPRYGLSGRGGRLNELSRTEAVRVLGAELRQGTRRWIVADSYQVSDLGPELGALLRANFEQDGCVWKRRDSTRQ